MDFAFLTQYQTASDFYFKYSRKRKVYYWYMDKKPILKEHLPSQLNPDEILEYSKTAFRQLKQDAKKRYLEQMKLVQEDAIKRMNEFYTNHFKPNSTLPKQTLKKPFTVDQLKTKKQWHQWLLKNHPDKGGTDIQLCQMVIAHGKNKGW